MALTAFNIRISQKIYNFSSQKRTTWVSTISSNQGLANYGPWVKSSPLPMLYGPQKLLDQARTLSQETSQGNPLLTYFFLCTENLPLEQVATAQGPYWLPPTCWSSAVGNCCAFSSTGSFSQLPRFRWLGSSGGEGSMLELKVHWGRESNWSG